MYSRFFICIIVQVALCEITGWSVHTNSTTDEKSDQIFSSSNFSFIPLTHRNSSIDLDFLRTKLAADGEEFLRKFEQSKDKLDTSPPARSRSPVVWIIVIMKIVLLSTYLYRRCYMRKHCYDAPVIVTTTSTTAGQYPVSVHPTPGGGLQATPYPMSGTHMAMPQPQMMATNPPYPTHGGAMPQPYGQEAGYPNPPYPTTDPSRMNPPSYDQVVSGGTQKQAPYNPHYMGN